MDRCKEVLQTEHIFNLAFTSRFPSPATLQVLRMRGFPSFSTCTSCACNCVGDGDHDNLEIGVIGGNGARAEFDADARDYASCDLGSDGYGPLGFVV